VNALPHTLFHGLFLAAAFLGVVESLHVAITGGGALSVYDRSLAAVYVLGPFVLAGLFVACITSALAAVWTRTRLVTTPSETSVKRRVHVAAALLTTIAFMVTGFGFTRLLFHLNDDRVVASALLAIATPLAVVGTLYLWAILRTQLARLDEATGYNTSTIIAAIFIVAALAVPATAIMQNDALAEFLGGYSVVFLVLYPLLTVSIALSLHRFGVDGLTSAGVRRTVVALGVLSAAGTVDLVYNLDQRPAVKSALLNHTLVFQPLVVVTQPLFDRDGDGYSGLLGGGDCNDSNPLVHPGAVEIPRNAIDDDCFGGDSPGATPPAVIVPRPLRPAVARGLVETPNIILITIDTLRADHLGFLGYERNTSPNLDRLASDGLRFSWAFSQGPQTRLSIPSMFVGRYYSEIDRSNDTWPRIYDSNVTLAERLKSAGYRTAGIPAHRFFVPNYGLHQGFDDWDLFIVEQFQTRMPFVVSGNLSTARALKWLKAQDSDGGPFFLWIHYFDPHFKYRNHPQFSFGDSELDRYDSEIRYTDEQIGKVLNWIQDSPFAKNTYTMVHSDHGEGFGMHGYLHHGQHLFNDQVRVPLIINGPGIPSRQIDTPVSLLDVVPTTLDLAGIPTPNELTGISLIPFGTETKLPEHPPVFIEMLKDATHSDRRVIVDWPWKLQYGITFDEYTLFNLAQDPEEQFDLHTHKRAEFLRLQKALRRWMSSEVTPSAPR
jgi:hypothetical protein